jgi:hypothetical protein
VGALNSNGGPKGTKYYTRMVSKVHFHRTYLNTATRKYYDTVGDIAILILTVPVPRTVVPIKLARRSQMPPHNAVVWGAGYGESYELSGWTRLRQAPMAMMRRSTCTNFLNRMSRSKGYTKKFYNLTDHVICTYGDGKTDTCWGDSGGPLFKKGKKESPVTDLQVSRPGGGVCCLLLFVRGGWCAELQVWCFSPLHSFLFLFPFFCSNSCLYVCLNIRNG